MEYHEQTAYFLVGPTASGKTEVAQRIAMRDACRLVSADSMLVYRDMDIGTAKPEADARAQVSYHGMDFSDPDQPSHVEAWLDAVIPAFTENEHSRPVIVVGGTGLYTRCLVDGLDGGPAPDMAKREHWERLLQESGVAALQAELKNRDPERFESLADNQNARRLVRALESTSAADAKGGGNWADQPRHVPFVGLQLEPEILNSRIESRVRDMYRRGLIEEVSRLLAKYPGWSDTARQAIGYAEAVRHMQGKLGLEEAIDRTIIRTRQLAKRQRTWFRHQANVVWVMVAEDMSVDDIAAEVMRSWEAQGPTAVCV